MTTNGQTLIRMEAVKKVFYTDEVETHALDNINIEIQRGEYVAIAGPQRASAPPSATSVVPVT